MKEPYRCNIYLCRTTCRVGKKRQNNIHQSVTINTNAIRIGLRMNTYVVAEKQINSLV